MREGVRDIERLNHMIEAIDVLVKECLFQIPLLPVPYMR